MRKSTIGVLIGLLAVGCGDPSDEPRDDAPESEQAERGSGRYAVTFAVKANPESLGSASVSIFNALGETCAGTSCKAYPLNQAYFQATPKGSARFVGWSGCSFVGLGHFAAATFLENVGVLDETCTANFADATGTTPEPGDSVGLPEVPEPGSPGGTDQDGRTRPKPQRPGTEVPVDDVPGEVTPGDEEAGDTSIGGEEADDGERDDGSSDGESSDEESAGGTVLDGSDQGEEPDGSEVAPGDKKPGKTTEGKTTSEEEKEKEKEKEGEKTGDDAEVGETGGMTQQPAFPGPSGGSGTPKLPTFPPAASSSR